MKRFFSFTLSLLILFCGTISLFAGQAAEQGHALNKTVYARGGTPITYINETIDYAYKIEEKYFIPDKLPGYLSNYTCGITAGGIAIAYYNRAYPELIPGHTGSYFLGAYMWGSQGVAINNMYSSLYTLMKATSEGVTLNGYLSGVSSYSSGKNKTATFTSAMNSSGQLNATQYKNAINNGKLLSIFLDGFTIISFSDYRTYSGYDTITTYINSGAHIMVAYGYYNVSYYNSSNICFRSDSYLYVHTGFSSITLGLVKLNQYCTIDACYITDIY